MDKTPEHLDDYEAASRLIDAVISLVGDFHPEHQMAEPAVLAQGYLLLARSYLADFALRLGQGASPEDAAIGMLKGDLPIPESALKAAEAARRKGLQ